MASNLNIGNELNPAMRAASKGVVGIAYDDRMEARITVNGRPSPAVECLGNEIGSYTQTLQALQASGAAVSTVALQHAEELDNGFREEGMEPIQRALTPGLQRGSWGHH